MISLLGAHRVGKTSLARVYAEKHGAVFVETSVSAIFKELGRNPADVVDFKTRLDIQEHILERLGELYRSVPALAQVIFDRSPIDMLGYTMAEATGVKITPRDQARFRKYTADCFDLTNRHFSTLLLVQPGIPLVEAKGKAALSEAYIEHLNSLMLGLTCDGRLKIPHYFIPRQMIDMDDRIECLENALDRSLYAVQQEAKFHVASGGLMN